MLQRYIKNMETALSKYKIRPRFHPNAISTKFDNRRVTVGLRDNGEYLLEFRKYSLEEIKTVVTAHVKNKMMVTAMAMTKETAECVLYSLAELMGYAVIKGKDYQETYKSLCNEHATDIRETS